MKKKSIDQLFLGFEEEKPASGIKKIKEIEKEKIKEIVIEKEKEKEKKPLLPMDLKRAALGWMVSQSPNAIGVRVPTRISKFCADIAAFWVGSRRGQIIPRKTMIIETRNDREECWPDCSKHEGLLKQLKEKKEFKRSLEEKIRKAEPQLKDTDNLFNEYESWRYRDTKNKDYHRCLKEIDDIEHAVYNGSFFEQLRRAEVADFLYLAVPEGTVHSDELADGWGLIYIKPDLSTSLVKQADFWDCPVEKKIHLAHNIAITCRKSLLFSMGIRETPDGRPAFTPIPHRRRGAVK